MLLCEKVKSCPPSFCWKPNPMIRILLPQFRKDSASVSTASQFDFHRKEHYKKIASQHSVVQKSTKLLIFIESTKSGRRNAGQHQHESPWHSFSFRKSLAVYFFDCCFLFAEDNIFPFHFRLSLSGGAAAGCFFTNSITSKGFSIAANSSILPEGCIVPSFKYHTA